MEIYRVSLEMVAQVGRLQKRVARVDSDLARQMRRAAMSVPLNISEGMHGRKGTQTVRFDTAMGSARETLACLHVAVAVGYLQQVDVAELADVLDRIAATMWKLTHRPG